MVVVRLVFQAKFGTANQVVAGFKQAMEVASQVFWARRPRPHPHRSEWSVRHSGPGN